MEFSIEDIIEKFNDNYKKVKNIRDLKKLKIDFFGFITELEHLGIQSRSISQFNSKLSGFFFADYENTTIPVFNERRYFHELYAEEGQIKLMRFGLRISDESEIIYDTYLHKNIETIISYELTSNAIEINDILLPKLKTQDIFIPGYDKFDSLDIITPDQLLKNQLEEELYDEDDDYDLESEINMMVENSSLVYTSKQTGIVQKIVHDLGNYSIAVLKHDANSNVKLSIYNNMADVFLQKYKVKANTSLELVTSLKIQEIKALNTLLSDKTNNRKELLGLFSDVFKNKEAILNTTQNKQVKIYFQEGLKKLNVY